MAAEPNRNSRQHPEIEPEIRPNLRTIEGGGESTPERGSLTSVPTDDTADDLSRQERDFGVINGGGESTPERGSLRSVDDVREQEATGGGWQNNYTSGNNGPKRPAKLKGTLGKKGPIGLIVAVLSIGGLAITSVTSFLPMTIRAVVENFYGNVSRATTYHYKSTIRYRIGNQTACASATSIRCKMATVNDKTLERYEKEGFKVDSREVGGRHIINSITFPDGTQVNDGDAFVAHMDASVQSRSRVFGVFNPRSGPYVGQNFTNKVLKKFGINKSGITLSGRDREAAARAFNREIGAPEDRNQDADDTRNRVEADVKGKASKVTDKVTNLLGLACGAYDMTRLTVGLVKAKNAIRYVAFGWLFIKLADQIRAGDVDPTTVAIAMGVLTKVSSTGENAGKSATDSPGYRAMANGDRTKLSDSMQKLLLGGNPALKRLDDTLIDMKNLLGTKTTHSACKASNDPVAGAALTTAMCAAGGGTGGSIIPGLGTAIGGLGGIAICTLGNLATAIAGGLIIGYVIEKIMPSVIDYLSGAPLDFDMSSVDAGNALTIGAGILFSTSGMSSGMKLGSKEEVSEFHQKVAYQADKEYAEVARYEARETPFDATNQYSFMGQLTRQINMGGSNVLASTLSTVGTTLANAQSSILSTAAYAADMPSPMNDKTMGKCADPELAEKDIACDTVGQPQTVQSGRELGMTTESNLNYMIGNGYITDDGAVNQDKDYAKFLEYCTAKDEGLPGTSTMSIAEADYDWPGAKCQEDSDMLANFRTYTSRIGTLDDEDTQYTDGEGGGDTDAGTAEEGSDIAGDDYKSEVRSVLGRAGTNQCVDFVLFRLVKHKVLKGPMALGNGKDVVGTLGRMGYKVDTTPAVHAVMSTPVTSRPDLGHTAMVSKVNADGSFVVEEYNFNNGLRYGTRTISAEDIKNKKMTFAHTEVDYK